MDVLVRFGVRVVEGLREDGHFGSLIMSLFFFSKWRSCERVFLPILGMASRLLGLSFRFEVLFL